MVIFWWGHGGRAGLGGARSTLPSITTAATTTTTRSAKKLKRKNKSINDKPQQQNNQNQKPNQNRQQARLIPGLPNEITELCLSKIKPSVLYSVCHSWRNFIYSPDYPPFLSLYAVLASSSPPNQHRHHHHKHFPSSSSIDFYSYDPISSKWRDLPQPPSSDPPLRLILKHPSFISRDFSVQTVSVAGKLVLLAATADNLVPALSLPLIFDPRLNKWSYGPPLSSPRRWCAAGACSGNVYVASGMGSIHSNEVAKSVEKLSFNNAENDNDKKKIEWQWEMKRSMNDERFSREAIDAVGFKNKLYMVNVKGCYAKEGAVYDTVEDEWEDMKRGMKSGWRGPVASMDEEYMFCVNEVKGVLREYDPERDCWVDLVQDERLVGAEQMSAAAGKVCVVQFGGGIVVLDVTVRPIRIWNVEIPPGFSALAVHILPRMYQSL